MQKTELNDLSVLVGKNIVSLRKKLNFTQKELAQMLEITQDSMMRIEKGMMAPKMSRIQHIASILKCPVPYLFISEENKSIEEYALYITENMKQLNEEDKKYLIDLIDRTMQYIKDKE